MLTRNDVLKISEPIEKMYADCTSQLLINLSRHFATDKALATREWEAKKLSEMGALTDESIEIIAHNTGQAPEAIRKAITEGMGIQLSTVEKTLDGATKAGRIQGATTTWNASPRVQGVVRNLTNQATEDFNVVNTVMLDSVRNRYASSIAYCVQEETALIEKLMSAQNASELETQLGKVQTALNASTMSVAVGAEARTTALRRTINQLANEGITGYIDAGGHHWSPEAYINMDIRTTVHNAAIDGQRERSADYGVSTFQISSHAGARPLCAPYQGLFYSWDGTSGTVTDLNGKEYHYDSIYSTSYGEAAGIFGINCGHSPQTFVDGYSVPRYEPTQDPQKNAEEYALSQRQRYMERQIRKDKTEALAYEAAGDKEAFNKVAGRIKEKNAQYKQFCSENGRTPRVDRTQVVGYNRSVAGKANAVTRNASSTPKQKVNPVVPTTQASVATSTRSYKLTQFADKAYQAELDRLFDNGVSAAKDAWEKLIPSGGVVADSAYTGVAHYSMGKVYFDASKDATNPRGVGCTYFHENGHAVDYFGGWISHDKDFSDALRNDYSAALKATGQKYVADQRRDLSWQIMGHSANGVSDICEGLSKGKCVGNYGHGKDYWNRSQYSVEQEAWAHMYEAAFLDGQRNKIEKFFPTAYKRFIELCEGVQ